MGNKKKSRKGTRIALGIVSVLLAVVLVIMATTTILAETILGNMNYEEKGQSESLSYEEALALKEQATIGSTTEGTEDVDESMIGTEMSEDEVNLDVEIKNVIGDEKHITNILLIGQDSLKGVRERSDTMLLVTVNTEKNSITITSFMRDMYVKIPGYYKEKLNAAYMLGGMDLLNETLYQNFGVVVDHDVEVSFNQFQEIINYLGGIDMEVTTKEANFINEKSIGHKPISAGMNHLNGTQALHYARFRDKTTGDFGRTERQRKLMNKLIEEYKNSDLTTMIGMVNEIMGMITTNMTKAEVLNYAVKFFPMLATAEINSQRVPFDGKHTNGKDYYYLAMIDGISVVVARMDENVEKLAESLS